MEIGSSIKSPAVVPFTVDNFKGMPYRNLGSSGLRVSNLGLGTWKIGYPDKGDSSRIDEKTAFSIFDAAMEKGVSFWDTANRYNNASGNAERIIGAWLTHNPHQRRNLVIATKVGGLMDGDTPNHCGLSRANILESVYASLKRLNVTCIDLLYFHAFDPLTPLSESLATIEDLVRQDIVRYFAVSNFTVDQLDAFRAEAVEHSVRSKIVAVQNQFDLLHGESPKHPGVRAYAEQSAISFIAWSPLAGGLLAGKYLDLKKVGKGDRLFDEQKMHETANTDTMEKIHELARVAKGCELSLNQLVIAYMLSLPGMGPVIASCSSISQLESNTIGAIYQLSESQKNEIKALL